MFYGLYRILFTKYVTGERWRVEITKMGPDNAGYIIWALDEWSFFFFFVLFATNEIFIAYISANLQNMQQRSNGGWRRPKWAQTMHLVLFEP